MASWPHKDPDETLDYLIDWTARLDGDNIIEVEWVVPAGIVHGAASNTTKTSTLWLSGGTGGVVYSITGRVTTAAGRTMDQSVMILVAPK